jgi:hypothetical protein
MTERIIIKAATPRVIPIREIAVTNETKPFCFLDHR